MPTLRVTISKRYCLAAIIVCIVMMTTQQGILYSQVTVFSADFETSSGDNAWFLQNTASDGNWIVGIPFPYQTNGIQMEIPAIGGNQDFVTGNNPGQDVDGGTTRARSPDIQLPDDQLTLSFDYYFSYYTNATNRDDLRVELRSSSNNDFLRRFVLDRGDSGGRPAQWSSVSVDISDFAGQTVYIRVQARDRDNGSKIEAAIDNVLITHPSGNELSGTVFLDTDDDGVIDNGEQGVSGVSVSLFDNNQLVQQVVTQTDGSYIFSGLDEQITYQIIFDDWEDDYVESSLGPDNGGAVQIRSLSDGPASLGFLPNNSFCEDPYLIIPCYVEGEISSISEEPAIVKVRSSAEGHDFTGVTPTSDYQVSSIASYGEVGTVYGVAWQSDHNSIYTGAFHKRYAPFGPGGPAAIYQLSLDGSLEGIIDLSILTSVNNVAGPDVHDFNTLYNNEIIDLGLNDISFDGVGKRSLGDIELNEDQTVLYVTNLYDRRIYAIDVSSGVASDASVITSWAAPDETFTDRHRPFALAWHDGLLWIGSVDEDGSDVYVHSLDVSTGAFTLMLSAPLDYPRQSFLGAANNPAAVNIWNPWQSTINFTPYNIDNEIAYPQPILSDIEFSDSGNMILGFRDRFGDQSGAQKYFSTNESELTWGIAQGDILRACWIQSNPGDPTLVVELENLSTQPTFSPFEVVNDPTASQGLYIVWPNNGNPLLNPPADNAPGRVDIDFFLTESSDVDFEIRVDFPNGGDNSFWYKIDNDPWAVENGTVTNGWEDLAIASFNNLLPGSHTLSILRREDGSRLDNITLTTSNGVINNNNGTGSGEFSFTLESGLGGSCETQNSGLTASGPGGAEFYYWDLYALAGVDWNPGLVNGAFHWETSQGGLVQIEGAPSIITTALDPYSDFSGGIIKLDNTTGARVGAPLTGPVDLATLSGGYTIYESGDYNAGLPVGNGTAGKANGLGDIEAACVSQHTIGNYVWFDEDQNGLQNSDELALSGVVVELFQGNNLIGRDTTDNEGFYFFGGVSNNGLFSNNMIETAVNYQIRISLSSAQTNSSGVTEIESITTVDAGDDRLDSDALFTNGYAYIPVNLEVDQLTDYTFDFGFTSCGVDAGNYLTDLNMCEGDTLLITTSLDNDATTSHNWSVLGGTTSSGYTISGSQDSILVIDAMAATPGLILIEHTALLSGCPITDSLIVSVIGEPAVEIVSSADTICQSEEIKLTAEWTYEVQPVGGEIPPSNGQGTVIVHEIFGIRDPLGTELTITLPTWDDHFAETKLNGATIIPEVLEPNSWNAGGMDTENPWLANNFGLPRSVIVINSNEVRYFRTKTVNSTSLEEVFPANWISTPQSFIVGTNAFQFGILNTAGPVSGSWSITAEASQGYDYLWSTGDTTMMITDSPQGITDYMVTVSNSYGCTYVAEKTIYAGVNNTESITYEGCSGDGYEVMIHNTIYNESNPTDTIIVMTSSGCDSTFYINLTYAPLPVVEAGSLPAPLCSNSIVTLSELNASISGGITTGFWTSTGDGSFDNGGLFGGSNPATTYTPSSEEISSGKAILTLTSDDPIGACEPDADAVMILINDVRCNTFPWTGG